MFSSPSHSCMLAPGSLVYIFPFSRVPGRSIHLSANNSFAHSCILVSSPGAAMTAAPNSSMLSHQLKSIVAIQRRILPAPALTLCLLDITYCFFDLWRGLWRAVVGLQFLFAGLRPAIKLGLQLVRNRFKICQSIFQHAYGLDRVLCRADYILRQHVHA